MGRLVRCISDDGLVLGAVVDSKDIVARAKQVHSSSPAVTVALGRLLTGASIMGNRLKEDDATLTIRVSGDGDAGEFIAVSDAYGNVRGLAGNPQTQVGTVSQAVGTQGLLGVIKDYGNGEPYTAQIPLVSGEIAEDLTSYYAVSEQTPTVMMLGVSLDDEGEVKAAGGLLIQLLPAADEREIEKIEASLQALKPISAMLEEGMSVEEIATLAFKGFTLEFFDEASVEYRCYCSREKVENTLMTLKHDELMGLLDNDDKIEVCCHFCDNKYYFTEHDLDDIANRKK